MSRWVALIEGSAPVYGDAREALARDLQRARLWGACYDLRPVADAEVDEDLAAELARWSTGDVLALSVAVLTARLPSLTDAEVLAAYHGETRGKGRSGALDAIATEIRRRGL